MIAAPYVTTRAFVLAIMWGTGPGHTVIGNSPEFRSYAACMQAQPSAQKAAVMQFGERGTVICVPKVIE